VAREIVVSYEILWEEMDIRNQAFWDATLYLWMIVSWLFEEGKCFYINEPSSQM